MQIEIRVRGRQGSGKTRLIAYLKRCLARAGLNEQPNSQLVGLGHELEAFHGEVPDLGNLLWLPGELAAAGAEYHALEDVCSQSAASWVVVHSRAGDNPSRSRNLVCSNLHEHEARHIAQLLSENPIPVPVRNVGIVESMKG